MSTTGIPEIENETGCDDTPTKTLIQILYPMKNKWFLPLFTAAFLLAGTSIFAQQGVQELNSPADREMQSEMRQYIEVLQLTPEQIAQTSSTLKWKMEEKQRIFDQMEKLKRELETIDQSADKQIMGTLTEEQKKVFTEKIAPQFKSNRAESVKQVSE